MKLRMINNLIAVERINKESKKRDNLGFAIPEVQDSSGVIKLLPEGYTGPLKEGDQIYFKAKNVEVIRIKGADLLIMEPGNVVAIQDGESHEDSKE